MSSKTLLIAIGTSWLLLLAGCPKDPGDLLVCGEGVSCPRGTRCAAKQAVCIYDACGDGDVDAGEACDDGGVTDGDIIDGQRCSSNCKSNESCGNGTWDVAAGELCDPTVATWAGRCAGDCQSILTCGNGGTDYGEECDHGPQNSDSGACTTDCKDAKCGDTHVQAGVETCDAGPESVSVKTVCPYGQRECQLCSACQTVSLTGPFCGDARIDSAFGETCDNPSSFACGTCGASGGGVACQVIPAQGARGAITIHDVELLGVTVWLGDSVGGTRTFEFVASYAPAAGNVPVDIAGATPGAIADTRTIAARLAAAINYSGLFVTAVVTGGPTELRLENNIAGPAGNLEIVVAPSVTTALSSKGMEFGTGCASGQRCVRNEDCVSGTCTYGKCR